MSRLSPGTFSTAARAVAVGGDPTVFVVEVDKIEAVRSNQRVFNLAPKYTPSATWLSEAINSMYAYYANVCHALLEDVPDDDDQRVFNLGPKYTPSATWLREALSQSAVRYGYILFNVAFVHLPHLVRRGSRV